MDTKPKLCECGCGEPAPIAKRNWHTKGIKKGEPLRFVCGHHRKGQKQSKSERLKRSRAWGNEVVLSPFLPDGRIVKFYPKQNRWYCRANDSRSSRPHARSVYEHYHGEIPEDMVVHHKNGNSFNLEDDSPDNLMLVPHKWNWRFFPDLAEGFGVPESLVTQLYCDTIDDGCQPNAIFVEVSRRLLQYKDTQDVENT